MGKIEREIIPDPFVGLVSSIVGQQISNKAAKTVWARLVKKLGKVTPENILRMKTAHIQACGMSHRKAHYIKGVAQAANSGHIDFNMLHSLEDDEIIRQLITLQGVGIWTAEMLLIFSLSRPDIVSYRDLAIRRGMMSLYNLEDLSREEFEKYRQNYSPYGSVASLYLWKLSGVKSAF